MTTETAPESIRIDPDMPDEIDFSGAVRGPAGRRLLIEWARYRRALRTIAQTVDAREDPHRSLANLRALARTALGDQTEAAREAAP